MLNLNTAEMINKVKKSVQGADHFQRRTEQNATPTSRNVSIRLLMSILQQQ